jgi:hypothetical protein
MVSTRKRHGCGDATVYNVGDRVEVGTLIGIVEIIDAIAGNCNLADRQVVPLRKLFWTDTFLRLRKLLRPYTMSLRTADLPSLSSILLTCLKSDLQQIVRADGVEIGMLLERVDPPYTATARGATGTTTVQRPSSTDSRLSSVRSLSLSASEENSYRPIKRVTGTAFWKVRVESAFGALAPVRTLGEAISVESVSEKLLGRVLVVAEAVVAMRAVDEGDFSGAPKSKRQRGSMPTTGVDEGITEAAASCDDPKRMKGGTADATPILRHSGDDDEQADSNRRQAALNDTRDLQESKARVVSPPSMRRKPQRHAQQPEGWERNDSETIRTCTAEVLAAGSSPNTVTSSSSSSFDSASNCPPTQCHANPTADSTGGASSPQPPTTSSSTVGTRRTRNHHLHLEWSKYDDTLIEVPVVEEGYGLTTVQMEQEGKAIRKPVRKTPSQHRSSSPPPRHASSSTRGAVVTPSTSAPSSPVKMTTCASSIRLTSGASATKRSRSEKIHNTEVGERCRADKQTDHPFRSSSQRVGGAGATTALTEAALLSKKELGKKRTAAATMARKLKAVLRRQQQGLLPRYRGKTGGGAIHGGQGEQPENAVGTDSAGERRPAPGRKSRKEVAERDVPNCRLRKNQNTMEATAISRKAAARLHEQKRLARERVQLRKGKEAVVIHLLTGTLYLHRGKCRSAEFVRTK